MTTSMISWRFETCGGEHENSRIRMTGSTDKAEIERAVADAIGELIRHGGNSEDVKQLIRQFEIIADDQAETESKIPD
jgi:hypothetical protein